MSCFRFLSILTALSIYSSVAIADRGNVVLGDYDADGRSDIAVARKNTDTWNWFIRYANGIQEGPISFGLAPESNEDTLLTGDFNADKKFELSVVRSINGALVWISKNSESEASLTNWGLTGDTPLTGYFGGSGETDRVAIRTVGNGLNWYIQNYAESGIAWGLKGDKPHTADINGDGVDELIVSRSIGGFVNWFIRDLSGNYIRTISWGLENDTLLPPSDFNGDGKADIIVARDIGQFKHIFIKYTELGDFAQSFLYGLKGDSPHIGNFTQNTYSELAMLRKSKGAESRHYVRFALANQVVEVPFGLSEDTLIQANGQSEAEVAEETKEISGCNPTSGTASDFSDGSGGGALWKPVSEGVNNSAAVILLPISYCGASISVRGSNGDVVSGIQRTKCGGNGNRAHFWLQKRASELSRFAPLTVEVNKSGRTECRSVRNPNQRYD